MIFIIDISKPFQLKPGWMVSDFDNVKSRRFWWLWFAFTYCPLSQFDYEGYIANGKTYWKAG